MKQKLLSFILLLTCLSASLYAQERQIRGTVAGSNGASLAGVSVSVLGSNVATQTDANGNFNIKADNGQTLIFSYIGYTGRRVEIGTQNVVNVTLNLGTESLEEIIVTGAYGIQSSARSTSYNAQVLNQEQLNPIRQTNINNALAGKVAGLQVRSQSAAALGRETSIRLRGESGLGSGTGVIYVVDGTILPNSNDINLDDIESVTVLQGPAASALFGSQGAGGAIVMTLIKGRSTPGVGISVNIGAQFEKPYILPAYQNLYAGGTNDQWRTYTWQQGHPEEWRALDGKIYKDSYDDVSWGPRMDGTEYIPWYAWYPGHDRSFQTTNLNAQPNNVRDFYETGVTLNNGITFRQSSEKLDFKVTYNNQYVNGLIPESSLKRNNINVSTAYRVTDKFEVGTNVNYINGQLNGFISDGYGNAATGAFSQWMHRDLDFGIMEELRGLNLNGIYASWNRPNPTQYNPNSPDNFYKGNYYLNPYTFLDFTERITNNDRLFGDVYASYKIIDGLSVKATYRKQQNTVFSEGRDYSELQASHTQAGIFAGYSTNNSYANRQNLEFLASFNRKFEDWSVNANVGTDFFSLTTKGNGGNTVQGLVVPNGFFLSNSRQTPAITNPRSLEKYNAIFGTATVGYKNMVFVNGTLRNDWFSTLPAGNNDVLSKSFGASFVFSDLLPEETKDWLSFGKVRYSWGEIPQALGTNASPFGAYRFPGMNYTINNNQWNGNILMPTPDQLVNPNIRGAVATQQELGIDLEFLRNRVGISATYWDGTEINFPFALSINGASGYTSLLTNIGEITKKGFELQLRGSPIRTAEFNWNVNLTYSKLINNDVVSLSPENNVTRTGAVANVAFAALPQIYHEEGKRWGQLIGSGIMRNEQGVPILDAAGYYQRQDNISYGSVLPDFTGGIQNTFTYKGFNLAFNIDYQFGGKFSSLSSMFGAFSGVTERTAEINDRGFNVRDAVADGGGKKTTGVNANGEAVEFYVPVRTYYENAYGRRTTDEFIFDLDFIKLREISFGYELPAKKMNLERYGIQNANIAVVGRNLWLIHSKTNGEFDPSEISGIAGETSQLPGTRGWGFNLRVGF
ncbi:SusC/RagA family TonB-linked outer membrane protein [Sphingobacterium sp. lm-10]|uniref:SusC/RagA family TonB-linked outer membrane protein n=1 Tax=Sphingobacterium sp. lm-10 TaxID=2944904 RepID=UPI0020208A02|nr:SusC/RagA family TonB-linked outer membrane protein [Sphingobacterium sp. lm-10]MCL7987452.1 SusC/RagA family TonB-linked outer membrane protein [Sphingobacterium sp. lm-10]